MKETADRSTAASVARFFRCIRLGASPLRLAGIALLLLGAAYSQPGWSHECPNSSNFIDCHVAGSVENFAVHSISAPDEAVSFTLAAWGSNHFYAVNTQFTCAAGGVELFGWRHVDQAQADYKKPTALGRGWEGFTLEVTSAKAPGIARDTTYQCKARWAARDDPDSIHTVPQPPFSVYVPSAARLIFNGSETDPGQVNPSLGVLEGGSSSFTVRLAGRPQKQRDGEPAAERHRQRRCHV